MSPAERPWLLDAVFYEIYPQSFADSNGDGIGDMQGVLDHLDHLQRLGVNALWFNPCFDSPFVDAGYDVSDYLNVAPRYGSNDDLIQVIGAARDRGIRVILDLVAGHTSEQHEWFKTEAASSEPDPTGDRYIWAEQPDQEEASGIPIGNGGHWVASPGVRPGYYLKNFYDAQPALNFGYAQPRAAEPWRQPVDAPGPRRNREALREIMAFWLDRGVAGFRVDMAFSLIKDDVGYLQTTELWRGLRSWLDASYPDAVILPEGSEPHADAPPAFHADFFLVIQPPHASLFANGGAGTLPMSPPGPCFFSAEGLGSTEIFLAAWQHQQETSPDHPVLLASADHDFARLVTGSRNAEQLGAAFTFLLTWGTVPSIYYGDEIGMRTIPGLPDKEGSICHPGFYNRAGCRTPMQWDDSANAGFSTAVPSDLYLPVDPYPDRPTVAAQCSDPTSILQLVQSLIALRHSTPALSVGPSTTVLNAGYPFVYQRGDTHIVVVNPRRQTASVDVPHRLKPLLQRGVVASDGRVQVDGFGYGVFELIG